MRSLSSIMIFLGFAATMFAQSPHGADLKINCAACHSPMGWKIDASYWQSFDPEKPRVSKTTGTPLGLDTLRFHHGKTNFDLKGRHATVDCRACHETLVFKNAQTECISCHNDVHQQTVGTDCARCHTPANWLIDNITDLHQGNGFPLTGVHRTVSCEQCHSSATNLQFNRIGNDCISCHAQDFQAAISPNHQQAGFSSDCLECHDVFTPGWVTNKVNHDFFPLTQGHQISDCSKCHTGGNFANTPNTCNACHQQDFANTQNPKHQALNLPTDCAMCHTTAPDWEPASFPIHNNYYALNGAHAAIANDCAVCHHGNYNNTPNTCNGCHNNDFAATTNPNHAAANFPTDCATCHSETAWAPSTFDHSTIYPFTGAHIPIANDCNACHHGNYNNTPNTCNGCHNTDFSQSQNPNHTALNIPTDCALCHTTAPGWQPASFPIHNNYYVLNGAHAAIANDCATCHNGNYNSTPNTCAGCHTDNYNQTTNPNHAALQFSTDCATCHTESAWTPATFNHDAQYFPIYSGKHKGEWSACADCHTNPSNYAEFTCVTCHSNPQTNNQHNGINGYTYNSSACLACHPTGAATGAFDHSITGFPLTGAHLTADCIKCHAAGYAGTPTQCSACHTNDFNQSANPKHQALDFPMDCALCHTTAAGWAPASFPIHNSYYVLKGAHATIANDCAACHNGNYNSAPNTCAGCHTTDYNQTTNPNHATLQFSTDCTSCHSETAWSPSTFDHSTIYPFTGAHIPIAGDCNACHNGNYTNTPNTCNGCHNTDFVQSANPKHTALNLPTDCAMCHTTVAGWAPASFPIHNNYYALNGAHATIANDCATCHNGNYNNTPNTCYGCHSADYNSANNPPHASAGFPTTCATCHSETAWSPSTFHHDQQYFPIYSGKHKNEWDQCVECHTTPNNFTSFSCIDCHEHNNATKMANKHQGVSGYQFVSTACLNCHPNGN